MLTPPPLLDARLPVIIRFLNVGEAYQLLIPAPVGLSPPVIVKPSRIEAVVIGVAEEKKFLITFDPLPISIVGNIPLLRSEIDGFAALGNPPKIITPSFIEKKPPIVG